MKYFKTNILCVIAAFILFFGCDEESKNPTKQIDDPREWKELNVPVKSFITDLIVRSDNDEEILFSEYYDFSEGKGGGVYRTTDRGETWEATLEHFCIADLAISPLDPALVYAVAPRSAINTNLLFHSMDFGATWDTMFVPFYDFDSMPVKLSLHPIHQNEMYLGYSGFLGGDLAKSNDGGLTWLQVDLGDYNGTNITDINFDDLSYVYVGTDWVGFLLKSRDDGQTWERIESGQFLEVTRILFAENHPSRIWVGTWMRGVWLSQDGGESWEQKDIGGDYEWIVTDIVEGLEGEIYFTAHATGIEGRVYSMSVTDSSASVVGDWSEETLSCIEIGPDGKLYVGGISIAVY